MKSEEWPKNLQSYKTWKDKVNTSHEASFNFNNDSLWTDYTPTDYAVIRDWDLGDIGGFGGQPPYTHPYLGFLSETETQDLVTFSQIPERIPFLESEKIRPSYDALVKQNTKLLYSFRKKSEKEKAESYIIRKWASKQIGITFKTLNDLACHLINENHVDDKTDAVKILTGRERKYKAKDCMPTLGAPVRSSTVLSLRVGGSLKSKNTNWSLRNMIATNDISSSEERGYPTFTCWICNQSMDDLAQLSVHMENTHNVSEQLIFCLFVSITLFMNRF
jgi:hypothetical protein